MPSARDCIHRSWGFASRQALPRLLFVRLLLGVVILRVIQPILVVDVEFLGGLSLVVGLSD
jgi:hypothetical protein